MLKKRIFTSLIILLFFVATLTFMAVKEAKKLRRDPVVLMNKYYHFKDSNPEVAKQALLIIIKQHANYTPAIQKYNPWRPGAQTLKRAKNLMQITVMNSSIPRYQDSANIQPFQMHLAGADKTQSKCLHSPSKTENIHKVSKTITIECKNLQLLKEAGFSAILQGDLNSAIRYFTSAYRLSYEPDTAMQLAYLYSQLNDNKTAYQYFTLATRSHDHDLAIHAENALTTLVGQQTKILKPPFFSEVYFNPFSESRFGLTVLPFMFRLGIEQANTLSTKEYLFLRRTQDNRSANLGEISQIYEDNVQITGVGGQIRPLKGLPLVGFLEIGAAYDLVYRNRAPWRWDLRGGFMYYKNVGKKPIYSDVVNYCGGYYGDWYGDATYFTRYSNLIGLIRTHQGIHLMEYHSSMLNLYMTGRVIADTRREFFNNLVEVGPGISFVPSNRFNLQVRFEHIKGMYLPAGATVNPYSKYYTNNVVQLLFYAKF